MLPTQQETEMSEKMKNLLVRTLSGVVLAVAVIGATLWSQWSYGALLLLLLVGCMHEFYRLASRCDQRPQRLLGMATGIVLFAINFMAVCRETAGLMRGGLLTALTAFVLLALSLMFVCELFRREGNPAAGVGVTLAGVVYVALPVSLMCYIPQLSTPEWNPRVTVAYIIFLANAISFKGIWYKPFEVSKTTKSTFHALSGDCQTEFMNISTELKYYKNSDFESVSVSLKGWFEFIAVLPSESKSVSDFSQSFNSTVFDEIKGRLALYDVDLSIPKFHENFKMTCSEIFRAIGLDVNIQNFEGFNPRYINRDELRLKVDHFTDINVDEEGASVTSVSTGNVGSVAPSVFGEASVTFDRPFIYLIRNTKTGSIIMMGQYTQPQ